MLDQEDPELHYFVKVDTTRISLSQRGLTHLAIECFCDEIKKGKKYNVFTFKEKEYANAFTNFINQSAKPSGSL